MNTPDLSKAQIVSVAQALIAVAVAFGVPISDQQSVALIALSAVLGTVLLGADASIRRARANNADKLYAVASVSQQSGDTTTTVTGPVAPSGNGNADGPTDVDTLLELMRKVLTARQMSPEPRAKAKR